MSSPEDGPIEIYLRRNSDGVVRVVRDLSSDLRAAQWQWGEGNYGCDCNRHLFFERAGGRGGLFSDPNDPIHDQRECSETDYAVVKLVDTRTGETLEGDPNG